MRIGIIGLGIHGSRYLNHILNDVEGIEVPAVSRRSMEEARHILNRFNRDIKFLNNYRDLLKEDLESVIITTPTGTHAEIAIEAMNKGLHVLVEKPMASSVEDCQRMIDSSKENDVILMISQTLRYNPTIVRIKQMVIDIDIEKILMEQHLEPPNREWLFNKKLAGGGVLLNTGVHIFDTIRFITNEEIIPIDCTIKKIRNPNLEDLAFGTFSLSDGGEGSFSTSRYHTSRRREISINKDNILADAMREMILKPEMKTVKGEKRTIIPLLEDFRDSIKNNKKITITGEDGMAAVKACENFYGVRT